MMLTAWATPASASTNSFTGWTTDPYPGGLVQGTVDWGAGCGTLTVHDVGVNDVEAGDGYHASAWVYLHKCDGSYGWYYLGYDASEDGYDNWYSSPTYFTGTGLVAYACLYYYGSYQPYESSHKVYCGKTS